VVIEEAWARYQFENTPYSLRAGIFKDPLDHEQQTSGGLAMAVERSLTADLLAAGDAFSQGVSLIYDPGNAVRAEIAFTDGIGSASQNFEDFPATSANWGTAARIEYKFFGAWNQYADASAVGNRQDLLVAGAGADYTEAGSTGAFRHVADVQYEVGNLGLYAAYLGRYTRDNPLSGDDTYDWSVRAQASYVLDGRWEPFVRYDLIRFDGGSIPAGTDPHVHELAIGFNYFLRSQQARFTVDAVYLPNGSPFDANGTGVLANFGDAQYLLRGQFQFSL